MQLYGPVIYHMTMYRLTQIIALKFSQ
jgi:hypothetical protein